MFEGQIAQLASPEELYRHPVSKRVASFIGVMNFLSAKVTEETADGIVLDIPALGKARIARGDIPKGVVPGEVSEIGVRPEMLTVLFDASDTSQHMVEAEVADTSYYGDMTYYDVRLPGKSGLVTISMRNTAGRAVAKPGSTVRVGWGAESVVLFK
jgi:spermidine/putrescine transport system ATP-binding protein